MTRAVGPTLFQALRVRARPAVLDAVVEAIARGAANSALSGAGVPAGAGEVRLDCPMGRAFALATVASTLGPGADWFAGVDGVP